MEINLPCSIESENAILGAVMVDDKLFVQCEDSGLSSEHFYLAANQKIFAAMAALREDRVSIDELTLTDYLRSHGELDTVGGHGYVSGLTSGGFPRNLGSYIRTVKSKWSYRKVIRACHETIRIAAEAVEPVEKVVSNLVQKSSESILTEGIGNRPMFTDAFDFLAGNETEPKWLVDGIIEDGSNGFLCGDPKASKSLVGIALAVALATKTPWMGFAVKRMVRVALVSREDNPTTTQRRLRQLSYGFHWAELREHLYLNTKQDTPDFRLDNPAHLNRLISDLKSRKIEFVLLDVLNVLHSADENDNTAMRKVMQSINRIQQETGGQVCVLHHWNKGESTSITKRMRGAGAIAGFAEWIIGIDTMEDESGIREMKFEIKGGENPKSIFYSIQPNTLGLTLQLEPEYQHQKATVRGPRVKNAIAKAATN